MAYKLPGKPWGHAPWKQRKNQGMEGRRVRKLEDNEARAARDSAERRRAQQSLLHGLSPEHKRALLAELFANGLKPRDQRRSQTEIVAAYKASHGLR